MNDKEINKFLTEIKRKEKLYQKNRRDSRFIETMGFLVSKGFLRTNYEVTLFPNRKIQIEDAIWAGLNAEPRILEVLPAAILRLGRHFDLNPQFHPLLFKIVSDLRKGRDHGDEFYGIPYDKIKIWANFPLKDKRIKALQQKKVPRTFRLSPSTNIQLKKLAKKLNCSETEALELTIRKEVENS